MDCRDARGSERDIQSLTCIQKNEKKRDHCGAMPFRLPGRSRQRKGYPIPHSPQKSLCQSESAIYEGRLLILAFKSGQKWDKGYSLVFFERVNTTAWQKTQKNANELQQTCSLFGVFPLRYRAWGKLIFQKGKRGKPPYVGFPLLEYFF